MFSPVRSRDNLVWQRAGRPRNWGSISGRARGLFFSITSSPSMATHPTSYPVGTGDSIPRIKAACMSSWPLPPTGVEVKDEQFYLLGYNAVKQADNCAYYLFYSGFLLGLFLDPEDRGYNFLRNVGWLSTDYTESYSRIQNSLQPPLWEIKILQRLRMLGAIPPLHPYISIARWLVTQE
jgi:hypothetical protein